ncbi:hypothetical protein BDR05DRAFT_947907 [Suillus weaverae]|nr:hypothetical protein BDR05DRAFT_947907 [Suillus weaverae]
MASTPPSEIDGSSIAPAAVMTNRIDAAGEHFKEIVLSNSDISVILAFAGSRLRACLTHLQHEDEVAQWSSERVTRIRAGLQWEIENFLSPVPDHLFTARLRLIDPLTEGGDPSRMVDAYDHEWWAPGPATDLTAPLPWIRVKKCVDNHVKQWHEGPAFAIPLPQKELGELPFKAQLVLMLERLDLNLLQYEGAVKEKLGDLRVPAQTIMAVDRARDPRVMRAFARGMPHMSSSSAETIHGLAIEMGALIEAARAMPVDADAFTPAKRAGQLVTKSIKLAPSVTAIPPILLSCAMALATCTRPRKERPGCEIFRAPDWGAIGYDDYRIMQHPQHKKAITWMASLAAKKDVGMVNVSKDGINWQAILRKGVDQLEVLGQNEHGMGARMSLQSLEKEVVELERTLQMDKPRSFGPAKRKAADINGRGIKLEKEDAISHKGKDREVTSDARGRKRRRMSHMSAKHVECSDSDMQIDELVEEPPRLEVAEARKGIISGTDEASGGRTIRNRMDTMTLLVRLGSRQTQATEDIHDSRCTPCKERGLNCIIGYSQKTGNKLNSCGECSMTKRKCVYGQEPETVASGPGRAASDPDKVTRLPAIRGSKRPAEFSSPAHSRRSVTKGSPRVEASSAPPIPTLGGVAINSIEERLVTLEAALAKLNTTIEQLRVDHGVLQQKVVSPHPTFLLSHEPPLSPVQIAMPSPAPFKPQLTPLAALSLSSTMLAV